MLPLNGGRRIGSILALHGRSYAPVGRLACLQQPLLKLGYVKLPCTGIYFIITRSSERAF